MKRLLCVLSNMNAGGAETFLMKLYRNLDREKYQMDFCINVVEKNFYEEEIISLGGKIYRIPSKSENVKGFKKALTNIIKENKYDYVLRITSTAMGFMDLKIAKKAGAKICAARSSNSSDGSFIQYIVHRIGRLLYSKYVDVKFAPSDLAAAYTFGKKNYRSGKVSILHNGIDLDVFKLYPDADSFVRTEFKIPDDAVIFGHVGRFNTQKNHTFLLDIFSEIKKKESKAVLLLVGCGNLENDIKSKAASLGILDSIYFAGVRSDVPRIMSGMKVFIFPSFYEGMPNTVIEAQSTGLPCIIADTITKEANITGLVEYLPLSLSAKNWAEKAISKVEIERKNTKDDFIEYGYDIQSVTENFVKLVVGE